MKLVSTGLKQEIWVRIQLESMRWNFLFQRIHCSFFCVLGSRSEKRLGLLRSLAVLRLSFFFAGHLGKLLRSN